MGSLGNWACPPPFVTYKNSINIIMSAFFLLSVNINLLILLEMSTEGIQTRDLSPSLSQPYISIIIPALYLKSWIYFRTYLGKF